MAIRARCLQPSDVFTAVGGLMVERAPFDFEPDEAPQEFPAEGSVPVPLPRDADGKIIRVDWSDGPKPPPPDPNREVQPSAYLSKEDGRAQVAEINAEHETPAQTPASTDVASFDELDANAQAVFVNEEGYAQAQDNIAKLEGLPNYAAMDADSEKLPPDAQAVVGRLLSRAGHVDADTLVEEYDALSDWLPLSSSAALRSFLVKHDFIKAG